VIIVDNVVRKGAVIDGVSRDADVLGTRRFFEKVSREPRVSATAIQTVGSKGYDGFAMLVVAS
jgi:predicted O-methyltransferase YrrM